MVDAILNLLGLAPPDPVAAPDVAPGFGSLLARAVAGERAAEAANPRLLVRRPDADGSRLDPELSARLERVIERMRLEHGHQVTLVEGLRSSARQDYLFAQGRSRPGPVVTWTTESKHELGRAADLMVDGGFSDATAFRRLQRIAAEEGLRTLGPMDPGHVELPDDGAASHGQGGRRRAGEAGSTEAAAVPHQGFAAAGLAAPAAVAAVASPRPAAAAAPATPGGRARRGVHAYTAATTGAGATTGTGSRTGSGEPRTGEAVRGTQGQAGVAPASSGEPAGSTQPEAARSGAPSRSTPPLGVPIDLATGRVDVSAAGEPTVRLATQGERIAPAEWAVAGRVAGASRGRPGAQRAGRVGSDRGGDAAGRVASPGAASHASTAAPGEGASASAAPVVVAPESARPSSRPAAEAAARGQGDGSATRAPLRREGDAGREAGRGRRPAPDAFGSPFAPLGAEAAAPTGAGAVEPAAGVSQAERVEAVEALRERADAQPVQRVSVRVGEGADAARVRVDLRNDRVRAEVATESRRLGDALTRELPELSRALERQGLDPESVLIRRTERALADIAPLRSTETARSADSASSGRGHEGNGGQRGAREGHDRPRREQNGESKE